MRADVLLLLAAMVGVSAPAGASVPVVRRFASGEAARFSNAWWFRTERGSVLVDAPYLAHDAAALRAEMDAAGALPLGAAILTGPAPERSWGLGALLAPATRVWGSRATATALEADFAGARERRLRGGIPLASMPRGRPQLTNTFTGSLSLGFEGYTLRLFEAGEPGAPVATVVFVPETGELFAGGLVWSRIHPVTSGADLGAWRRALATLRRLAPRIVYPGHGEAGGSALLERMSDYLGTLEEVVRPLALRSALSRRELATLRKRFLRTRHDWLLPDVLDANLRSEHARLRRLLAPGG